MQNIEIEITLPRIDVELSLPDLSIDVEIPNIEFSSTISDGEPVSINGSNGFFTYEAESGEEVFLPGAIVKNTEGVDLLNLDPGQTEIAPNGLIRDSLGNPIIEVASGGFKDLADISVIEINGSVSSERAQQEVRCAFFGIKIREFDNTPIATISEFTDGFYLPEPDAIGYQRVIPKQYNSYRIGDTGYHTQQGRFFYLSDAKRVKYNQCLDYDTYGELGFYWLKFQNAWGNYHRFTNSIGNGPNVGNAGFNVAGFVGALDGYVIDNLTGVGYYVLDLGLISASWNSGIDAVAASSALGYTDWYPLSAEHSLSVIRSSDSYVSSNNIFYYIDVIGVPYNFFWLGDTVERLSSNAHYHRVAQSVIDYGSKTGLSSATILMARNHF